VQGAFGTVLEMSMGPDGRMYYADAASGSIGRIDYVGVATGGAAAITASAATTEGPTRLAFATTPTAVAPAATRRSGVPVRGAFDATDRALELLLIEASAVKDDVEPDAAVSDAPPPSELEAEAPWLALGEGL
jgi:hypothetical protein